MRVTQDDALSLLGKYAEERKPVLALLVTPSLSVARAMGTIHVSILEGVPRLLVGEEDNESKPERIKFRLSDCVFEYGDFREAKRDEDSAAHKYEVSGYKVQQGRRRCRHAISIRAKKLS
jgi:hypothetical protein